MDCPAIPASKLPLHAFHGKVGAGDTAIFAPVPYPRQNRVRGTGPRWPHAVASTESNVRNGHSGDAATRSLLQQGIEMMRLSLLFVPAGFRLLNVSLMNAPDMRTSRAFGGHSQGGQS
jgi:hypothetical protein